ncbi:TRAP transporter substrate-binding protein DctP [Polyangium sp. 6x1]|uniref:TRAP transporter substrate-binding protein DctP n=1 Tax=Polyangium sp. 6x1 TaxID=3042689 RepID=UPI002482FF4B|nr:TRAP transporter substrate-binding protein DctP [Polyangium sp. 6x1]MDI1448087.1 TRAP transporter substrate-binding protein DctP [Polyangium sp. 6x1]
MMQRRAMMKLLGALTVLVGIGASQDASAAEVIKIGTLAPKASPWGQVFSVWEKAVKEKSGGRLELQFFYNGQQGDEGAMVGKMKAGQLDGAAVTAVGLGKIYKPILALQMPGLFSSWAKLDAARETMRPEFEKGAADAGFSIMGWGDVGQAHLMTKGVAVRAPEDFKGTKPYVWRDDAAMPVFFQVIGGVTPVPLNIPEVLPNLNTGAVNALVAPALVAEQLQWASKLDTIVSDSSGFAVGALVLTSKKLDSLPEDLRAVLRDTGKIAASALTKRIRSEDDAAFARLKGKMTVVDLTADQKAKWQGLFKQVRGRLAQGTFSPDLVAKLEGLGG